MTHVRQQIRKAIGAACTGLSTTGSNVFTSRVYPVQATDLPCLLVYSEKETSARVTAPAPGLMQRTATITVRAVAQALADLDDTLDQICKEVEIALAMPNATLSMAKSITLVATEIEMQGTTEKPTGQAALTYEVVYMAVENAPDAAY